jgi:hypothetical protein
MLSEDYGFQAVKTTQVRFAPETPWTNGQKVCVTFKTAISCTAVKLVPYTRHEFTLHIADEPWESGEVLLPTSFGKDQIWAHLQSLHPIPDVSQFQVISGRKEITKDAQWPPGRIEAIPFAFSVSWRIELPQEPSGILEFKQEGQTPLVTARGAWDLLHHNIPHLCENATLNFNGFLRPGLTITAEIGREKVRVAVSFEVIRKGCITYISKIIPNMVTWQEIHGRFSSFDKRIPPFDCYMNEENRPYYPETRLEFRLAKDVEIPDTTREFGGGAG